MVTKKIQYGDIFEVSTMIHEIDETLGETGVWDENTHTYFYKENKIKITLPEEPIDNGEMSVNGKRDTVLQIIEKVLQTKKITQQDISAPMFSCWTVSQIFSQFGELTLAQYDKFVSVLGELNIKNIYGRNHTVPNICTELTLCVGTTPLDVYDNILYGDNDIFSDPDIRHSASQNIDCLKNKDGKEFCVYVKNANQILVPRQVINFDAFLDSLISIKGYVECMDPEELLLNSLITGFMKKKYEKMREVEQQIKNIESNINDYQSAIHRYILQKRELNSEIDVLKKVKDISAEEIWKKIKDAKKLKFLKDVGIGDNGVFFTFKPTFIKEKFHGKVIYIYNGEITINYSNTGFYVTSDLSDTYNAITHPHVNHGTPCLGSGTTAANLIFELAANLELEDLSYLLLQWIRTFKDNDCYHHVDQMISNRMSRHIPCFYANGEKLSIHDEIMDDISVDEYLLEEELRQQAINEFEDLTLIK